MKIAKDTAVTLRVKVSDSTGKLIDDGTHPTVYLHGGYENTFPKIEAALEGQEPGFQFTMTLPPEDAFGVRDEALLTTIDKKNFPPGVKVGGQLQGRGEDGQDRVFNVVKIKGPVVHLDANHPLADLTLRITGTVVDVRAASAEEITHKHVHGEHGHHH
ncbi:FKBP-type peptidyl-prolyl cis-trans isomerase [Candidatus Aalborgicola defluviihabitans]|uniref:FKBP-type peptidyl-prolyl cis-trans isomerase n=1 Tax=Candidatus Aalborgicola defluviihabitans TaxID=3386187 RepID=UPI001EC238FE|nr:peptidylprolyl isomerase [Burkholderiales bacterium]MBK7282302.1 peptidylprolyl isomerase [Burkholderiales bacterium]